mmetsp:Transcript_15216/g.36228  ORF Transcript_15216/g.36228 Transcript_15216/m.36228 type:complete len:304 (-) Transcript_15216:1651-2562(-)
MRRRSRLKLLVPTTDTAATLFPFVLIIILEAPNLSLGLLLLLLLLHVMIGHIAWLAIVIARKMTRITHATVRLATISLLRIVLILVLIRVVVVVASTTVLTIILLVTTRTLVVSSLVLVVWPVAIAAIVAHGGWISKPSLDPTELTITIVVTKLPLVLVHVWLLSVDEGRISVRDSWHTWREAWCCCGVVVAVIIAVIACARSRAGCHSGGVGGDISRSWSGRLWLPRRASTVQTLLLRSKRASHWRLGRKWVSKSWCCSRHATNETRRSGSTTIIVHTHSTTGGLVVGGGMLCRSSRTFCRG